MMLRDKENSIKSLHAKVESYAKKCDDILLSSHLKGPRGTLAALQLQKMGFKKFKWRDSWLAKRGKYPFIITLENSL